LTLSILFKLIESLNELKTKRVPGKLV